MPFQASVFLMSKALNPLDIIRKSSEKPLRQSFALARETQADADSRTVELSFSSDNPIYHWFGYLILDHGADSARFDRLNENGALLWHHNADKQIGSVSNARIDEDKRGRCTAKFSRAAFAEEKFQDVRDGICRSTSFGFSIYELSAEVGNDGKQLYIDDMPVYRSRDWEPFEVSLEPIPADTSVGASRALNRASEDEESKSGETEGGEEENSKEKREDNSENSEEKVSEDADTQESRANSDDKDEEKMTEEEKKAAERAARSARLQDFNEIGEFYQETELAREYELDGKTETELLAAIREKRAKNTAIPPKNTPHAEIETRMIAQAQLKAFRGENALARATRFGHFLSAVLFASERSIQYCRENGIPLKRAQSEADNESGGVFVPHEFENVLIDLRLEYGVFRRNANVVPMASESKSRPRRKGGLKAYPIGAVGASRRLKESKMNWDQVYLLAKKWGVLAKFEEELSEDAVISMADTLAAEIAYAFTQVEDECGFYGDGSSEYHGITGVITKLKNLSNDVTRIAGLQVASGNEWGEVTLADILGVVGRLPSFARNSGQIKWYCTAEFWATVLCKIALTAGGATTESIQGETRPMFLGKPVEFVEAMPHVQENGSIPLLYGNLAQAAMFGDRRGVTIKMTDSNDTDFEEDLMAIKGTERFDINVHDVGNADADPKKRLAGPIVGLIMQNS